MSPTLQAAVEAPEGLHEEGLLGAPVLQLAVLPEGAVLHLQAQVPLVLQPPGEGIVPALPLVLRHLRRLATAGAGDPVCLFFKCIFKS